LEIKATGYPDFKNKNYQADGRVYFGRRKDFDIIYPPELLEICRK